MPTARYYAKKFFAEHPLVLFKKICGKTSAAIRNTIERKYDLIRCTYVTGHSFSHTLQCKAESLPSDCSAEMHPETLAHLLNHCFNLLGSGWVRVCHGMQCRGLSGYRYDMGQPVHVDGQGSWLVGRINASNVAEAQRIWSLVDRDYTPIDWQIDFRSGYRWSENTWHRDIQIGHKPGADVIVPWELARMQHLPHMALNFRLSSEDSEERKMLSFEFRNQVLDFIATNPPQFGVNWFCEMDIAIRAVNWLVALCLFENSIELPAAWQSVFFQSIEQHGKRLYKKVRKPSGNMYNHFATQLAGLYCISVICPFFKESETWRAFAKNNLEAQIVAQVRPDGAHIEESTSYHLLATDIFLYTGILADSFNDPFSPGYRSTVQKMLAVIETVSSSRYDVPQIGDNDEGFFIKPALIDRTHTRAGHLLRIGRQYADRHNKWTVNEAIMNMLVIEKQEIPQRDSNRTPGVHVLESAGWAILKDGHFKIVMCLGAPGVATRVGHAHEDILSFTLYWKGLPVIVDPGSYVYTPDRYMRNTFRYAISHNQPRNPVNEAEWANKPVFFKMKMPVARYSIDRGGKTISAEAHYDKHAAARNIAIKDTHTVIIIDSIQGNVPQKGTVSLCVHPDVQCYALGKGNFELRVGGDTLAFETDSAYCKKKGFYSAGYGLITETDWLQGEAGTISIKLSRI